jgi:hypothetical protein
MQQGIPQGCIAERLREKEIRDQHLPKMATLIVS